jgi:hypothetical protein
VAVPNLHNIQTAEPGASVENKRLTVGKGRDQRRRTSSRSNARSDSPVTDPIGTPDRVVGLSQAVSTASSGSDPGVEPETALK